MKTVTQSTLLALALLVGMPMPALAQTKDAIKFSNFLCELDLRQKEGGAEEQIDGVPEAFQRSEFTFVSRKACAGTASLRNAKIECEKFVLGWTGGDLVDKKFECAINADPCGITPKENDPNAPLVTASSQIFTITAAGKAKLTCFYQPK